MKKITLFLLFVLLCSMTNAQEYAKYWVQFKDKSGTPFSLRAPEQFLSERAIQLRQKHHIPIDSLDLPVNPNYVRQVLAVDSTLRLCTQSKWLNGVTVYSEKEGILDTLTALPFVAFVEKTVPMKEPETVPDTPFVFASPATPSFTYLSDIQNEKDFDYGLGEAQVHMNNAQWLHRMGFRGENMRMMIMDGGFSNADTLSVFANMHQDHRLLGARNLVQPEVNPFRKHTHGTSVLSCIAAYVPGKMVGSAPMVEAYLCKTEDARSENKVEEDNWVAGIELADSLGCQVLNSSLGYTKFDDSTQVRGFEDLDGKVSRASRAATIAAKKGMLVCNSAGNEGSKPWCYIGTPADARDILSVGAVDTRGVIARFSSHGPAADGRVKPDACAMGLGCFVASQSGFFHASAGTSFSSPIMAGMAACLWQAFPDKSNLEILDAIRKSGDRYDAPDTLYGYGITDMLAAYNRLLQPDRDDMSVSFDDFVADDNRIYFSIGTGARNGAVQTAEVEFVPRDGEKSLIRRIKLNEQETECEVKLPALSSKVNYRIYDVKVRVPGHQSMQFVVCQQARLKSE